MYTIKPEYLEKIKEIIKEKTEENTDDGYPNLDVIEEYENGTRKAQENTVRALAAFLGIKNWRDLV